MARLGKEENLIFLKLSVFEMFFRTQKCCRKDRVLQLDRIGLLLMLCNLVTVTLSWPHGGFGPLVQI